MSLSILTLGVININNKDKLKRKILLKLLNTDDILTTNDLATYIEKSNRTVRTYINELKCELKEKNIQLIAKPNVGVFLEVNDEQRAELKRSLKDQQINHFSAEYRIYYILSTLLRNKFTYTILLFAEELYCSKTTISNDLIHVEEWLEARGLRLVRKQNQGLWVEGSERNYRKALIDLLHQYHDRDRLTIKSQNNNITDLLDYRFDISNYNLISELFPFVDLISIQQLVKTAEERLGYFYADQDFINLITHIAITIERVKNNQQLRLQKNTFESIRDKQEYTVAAYVVKEIEQKYNIKFCEDEIGYLALHMLGAKIQGDFSDNNYDELLSSQNEEYIALAVEIIKLASDILNIDLTKDKLLLTSLVLHLRPTIIRLKYGLKLRNPLLSRIKDEYTSIFGAAWACNIVFERKYGFFINEDEVAYIAMHLAVAVARQNNKIKAVVVCSCGVGVSQLVASRLRSNFSNIEVIAVLPVSYLKQELIKQADIIISTTKYSDNPHKVVHVSSLLDDKDILKIREYINNFIQSKTKLTNEVINKNPLVGVLDEEFCYIYDEKSSFIDIIKDCGKRLIQKGYVKEGFIEDVLDREKKGSTYIGKGIAIPHGNVCHVTKSKVCTIKLNTPIIWNGNEIKLIFLLALKFDESESVRSFFKSFYSVLEDEDKVTKILNAKDEKNILNLLLDGGINDG